MGDEPCKCGHPSGPHVLVSTVTSTLASGAEIPAGGWMYCPVDGCACWSTWSVPDAIAGFDVRARVLEVGEPDAAAKAAAIATASRRDR
jgi:hypothetical protein